MTSFINSWNQFDVDYSNLAGDISRISLVLPSLELSWSSATKEQLIQNAAGKRLSAMAMEPEFFPNPLRTHCLIDFDIDTVIVNL
ncbi:hypothetical protein PGT21_016067 [Puccinia graminis f. sp. tritici]|uniref:Uncharacterized protein n=1 Tax=Puccinia graminis f. sp. tritici TaxID=56615 RepID=A0A5B0LXR1_PUCGR|nr:hypothetical protein PGT21_016067 [Puccinia graminis f. sp. tritici]